MAAFDAKAYRKEYWSRPENRARKNANAKKRAQNPWVRELRQNSQRKCLYGITAKQFRDFLVAQNDACAGCRIGVNETKPHVDHDHVTGKVRGLLCGNCNKAIGLVHDDPVRLRALAAYLEE